MKLRFIGKNGSMGLVHGEIYDVKIMSNSIYILAYWSTCPHPCPYSSPQTFAANWENP